MIGLTVTQLRAAVTGQDGLGNDIYAWTAAPVQAYAFVPGQTTEAVQGTEQVSAAAELYLPPGTDVAPTDQFELPDGTTWNVLGQPSPYNSPFTGIGGTVMVRLQRVTGASAHTVAG